MNWQFFQIMTIIIALPVIGHHYFGYLETHDGLRITPFTVLNVLVAACLGVLLIFGAMVAYSLINLAIFDKPADRIIKDCQFAYITFIALHTFVITTGFFGRYKYQTKDGKKDKRYKDNPYYVDDTSYSITGFLMAAALIYLPYFKFLPLTKILRILIL